MHSYWDDFFAVRALADAADAAAVLGDATAAARIGALRDAMRADLRASIARAIAEHGIDFVPGSVELGDFDPTSTAIAFDPCGDDALLPPAALARTFERYWRSSRRAGAAKRRTRPTRRTRCATPPPSSCSGSASAPSTLLDWLIDDQRLARVVRVAGDRLARPRARRASSATCRTAGWRRASCAPCAA